MAAIDAVIKLLSPGDEVISTNDLYGGSYRIFTKIFQDLGIVFHFVDMQDPANVAAIINAKTKLIWIETPTNPMMNVVDITAMSQLVADKDIYLAVDNTFASPYLQQPLSLGADIVMHSATKYLGGHSDVILGALVVRDAAWQSDCRLSKMPVVQSVVPSMLFWCCVASKPYMCVCNAIVKMVKKSLDSSPITQLLTGSIGQVLKAIPTTRSPNDK